MKLPHLDAPFAMKPHAAFDPYRNRTIEFWGPCSMKTDLHRTMWFCDPTTKIVVSSAPRAHPPRLRHVSRRSTTASAIRSIHTSSRRCVSQVSTTTASHLASMIYRSNPSARLSPLPIHRHEPAWPLPSISTTVLVLHTYTPQAERHVTQYATHFMVSPPTQPKYYPCWQSPITNSNHKEQIDLVFAISPLMSALSTPPFKHID